MFPPMNPPEKTGLEEAIDSVLSDMKGFTSDTEEYQKMVDQLVKLHKLKEDERPPRLSPDVAATIAANLLGIFVIVGHERAHIVTSKALGFVRRI